MARALMSSFTSSCSHISVMRSWMTSAFVRKFDTMRESLSFNSTGGSVASMALDIGGLNSIIVFSAHILLPKLDFEVMFVCVCVFPVSTDK